MQKNDIKSFTIITLIIVLIVFGIIYTKNKVGSKDSQNLDTNETTSSANDLTAPDATVGDNTQPEKPDSGIIKKNTDIMLFYGSTCPHCKKVEEYISANKIDSYLSFQNLEVYDNQDNAKLMTQKQNECKNLSDDNKGSVPFLYSSETCLVGSDTIIDYLKQQAGF